MTTRMILNDLLNLFYPRLCLLCQRSLVEGEEHICLHCSNHLPYTHFTDMETNPVCLLLQGKTSFVAATALLHFTKGGSGQKLIHSLKYHGNKKGGTHMSVLFLEYPKCSTCKKAKAWLEGAGVDFMDRHIVENNPTAEELKQWHAKSGLPLKKFFNTSGMLYKEMQLKDKLADMSDEEQFALLATNGMLVKRPLIIGDDFVLVGFKEAEWERLK